MEEGREGRRERDRKKRESESEREREHPQMAPSKLVLPSMALNYAW